MAGTDETSGAGSAAVPGDGEGVTGPVVPAKAARKAKGAASPDPEALAADIEKTREELAETLDAIAEKVSPKRVAKRTTKKVTSSVKETAHDAAAAVKETAATAKDKVSGGRAERSWAPDPGPVAAPAVSETDAVAADAVTGELAPEAAAHPLPLPATAAPAAPVDATAAVDALAPAAAEKPWYAPQASTTSVPASPYGQRSSLLRPEYVAAGAAAALVAWLLVRRRR